MSDDKRLARIKGILFDWDGTVVDSAEPMFLSYRYAYRQHLGVEFPKDRDEFRNIVGMRLAESSAKFGGKHAREVAESYNFYYNAEAYKTGQVYAGIAETIEALKKRGYSTGVVSNKSRQRIDTDITFLGLAGLIDVFVTSEDTVERKPHPAPLLKGAEKLGLTPEEIAYVGDYSGDVVAAKAAGMLSVGALWGGIYLVEELLAEEPEMAIGSPSELLEQFHGPGASPEGEAQPGEEARRQTVG